MTFFARLKYKIRESIILRPDSLDLVKSVRAWLLSRREELEHQSVVALKLHQRVGGQDGAGKPPGAALAAQPEPQLAVIRADLRKTAAHRSVRLSSPHVIPYPQTPYVL